MTENLPTNWQQQMEAEARAISRVFRPTTAQISTKSGIMSYMNQPVPGNKLDAIIIASIFENNYFPEKFDPRNPRNPTCYAFGKPDGDRKPEMVPFHEIPEGDKQAVACSRCVWSQWGSDPDSMSGKGKKCKEFFKLGLIPKNGGDLNEMAILRIPVTSRKNWEVYVNGVAAQTGRPPWGIVTEISIAPHQRNQFEIRFAPKEMLDESVLAKIFPKIEGAYEALMQRYEPNADPLAAREPATDRKRKY